MRSEMELVDGDQFQRLVSEYANFNDQFAQMSVKQRTSYFVIPFSLSWDFIDH